MTQGFVTISAVFTKLEASQPLPEFSVAKNSYQASELPRSSTLLPGKVKGFYGTGTKNVCTPFPLSCSQPEGKPRAPSPPFLAAVQGVGHLHPTRRTS